MHPREAQDFAQLHLGGMHPRWEHVQAVARVASEIAVVVPSTDRDVLLVAAWLHDIGYAPQATETGFHPLDGARYLRQHGVSERICALVAHHSCALCEAEERGLRDQLEQEFQYETSAVTDALWYADMTTGPKGDRVTVNARVDEVATRYGPNHPVAQGVSRARPLLLDAAGRTLDRLTAGELFQPR